MRIENCKKGMKVKIISKSVGNWGIDCLHNTTIGIIKYDSNGTKYESRNDSKIKYDYVNVRVNNENWIFADIDLVPLWEENV